MSAQHSNTCTKCRGEELAINDTTAKIRSALAIIANGPDTPRAKGAASQVKRHRAVLADLRSQIATCESAAVA